MMYDNPSMFATTRGTGDRPHRTAGGRRLGRFILPVAVATLAVAGWGAPGTAAPPAPITCGTVLTESVTLVSDLDCAGDGLIIGADGVAINLAGHSLTGNGTGTGIRSVEHGDLTVRNGTIAGFATGVDLFHLQRAEFTSLTIRDGQGVHLELADDVQFKGVALRDTRVFILHSQRTSFEQVSAENGSFFLSEAIATRIAHSRLTDTGVDGFESDQVSIVDNQLIRSPISYRTTSRDWLIQSNIIRGAQQGVLVLNTSPRGRILNNIFMDNEVGVWVDVNFLDEIDGTVISDNMFFNSGAAGLLVDVGAVLRAPTMTVSGNRFLRNGFQPNGRTDHVGRPLADGAHFATADGSLITVADNMTNHNAAYGIFAEPGTVVDGGGNSSIGDPLGCLGVVCA